MTSSKQGKKIELQVQVCPMCYRKFRTSFVIRPREKKRPSPCKCCIGLSVYDHDEWYKELDA